MGYKGGYESSDKKIGDLPKPPAGPGAGSKRPPVEVVVTTKRDPEPGCRVRITNLNSYNFDAEGTILPKSEGTHPLFEEIKIDGEPEYEIFHLDEFEVISWPRKREEDQVIPTPNDAESSHDVLIKMVQDRKDLGLKRYGTLLQPNNGRDNLKDAIEELVDLLVYLITEKRERDLKCNE